MFSDFMYFETNDRHNQVPGWSNGKHETPSWVSGMGSTVLMNLAIGDEERDTHWSPCLPAMCRDGALPRSDAGSGRRWSRLTDGGGTSGRSL